MYLLRNSGRYRTNQYRIVDEKYISGIAIRFWPHELASLGAPELRFEFGEVSVSVEAALHAGMEGTEWSEPRYLEARLAMPIRDIERSGGLKYVIFGPQIVREFCDFLTVVTGSYVISRLSDVDGKPVEDRSDKPWLGVALHLRRPITESFFHIEEAGDYASLFERFMQMHWGRHRVLVDAFRCFRLALGFCECSPSVSYLLLVAGLEACAAAFVDAEPTFDDFSDSFRETIASWEQKYQIDPHWTSELHDTLIAAEGQKLRARHKFRAVVETYLPERFWDEKPQAIITREGLRANLNAVYDARSNFVHTGDELGVETSTPGYSLIPAFEFDRKTGKVKETPQRVPTLDWFARMTRAVLIGILEADHPPLAEGDPDPETWLWGRSVVWLPVRSNK